MPDNVYPPSSTDSGALTVPRQLNRWLDVNPQGGALKRTSKYLTLPAFIQNSSTWNGYSDIIYSFNVEAPNRFSLKDVVAPSSPNYTLCVSFREGIDVTRYIIWEAAGTVLDDTIPLYSGQVISNNFRFEVWNTSQGVVSNVSPLTFYTSVRGGLDYRYGTDSVLENNDGQQSSFTINAMTSGVSNPFLTTDAFFCYPAQPAFFATTSSSTGTLSAKEGYGQLSGDSMISGGYLQLNSMEARDTLLSPSIAPKQIFFAVNGSGIFNTGHWTGSATTNQWTINTTDGYLTVTRTGSSPPSLGYGWTAQNDTYILILTWTAVHTIKISIYSKSAALISTVNLTDTVYSDFGDYSGSSFFTMAVSFNPKHLAAGFIVTPVSEASLASFISQSIGWSVPLTVPSGSISVTN